jgi:hypothetical protein
MGSFSPPYLAHDPGGCGRDGASLWLEARRRQGRFDRVPEVSFCDLAVVEMIRRPHA